MSNRDFDKTQYKQVQLFVRCAQDSYYVSRLFNVHLSEKQIIQLSDDAVKTGCAKAFDHIASRNSIGYFTPSTHEFVKTTEMYTVIYNMVVSLSPSERIQFGVVGNSDYEASVVRLLNYRLIEQLIMINTTSEQSQQAQDALRQVMAEHGYDLSLNEQPKCVIRHFLFLLGQMRKDMVSYVDIFEHINGHRHLL